MPMMQHDHHQIRQQLRLVSWTTMKSPLVANPADDSAVAPGMNKLLIWILKTSTKVGKSGFPLFLPKDLLFIGNVWGKIDAVGLIPLLLWWRPVKCLILKKKPDRFLWYLKFLNPRPPYFLINLNNSQIQLPSGSNEVWLPSGILGSNPGSSAYQLPRLMCRPQHQKERIGTRAPLKSIFVYE